MVLVDVAVFVSTGLYMTPARLPGTPSDRAYHDAVFTNQLEAVVFSALVSLLVGTIAAALIPRLLLDPLRQLRRSTRSLMEGQYTESVPRPRVPELNDLVQNVNVLAARLADLEVRRARLVSDVAHELRTPLTIIDGQLAALRTASTLSDLGLIASVREEVSGCGGSPTISRALEPRKTPMNCTAEHRRRSTRRRRDGPAASAVRPGRRRAAPHHRRPNPCRR